MNKYIYSASTAYFKVKVRVPCVVCYHTDSTQFFLLEEYDSVWLYFPKLWYDILLCCSNVTCFLIHIKAAENLNIFYPDFRILPFIEKHVNLYFSRLSKLIGKIPTERQCNAK